MLAMRLPKDLEVRLDSIAKRTGRTKRHIARQAIAEKLEDLEDIDLADARMRDPQPSVAWEAVRAKNFDSTNRAD